MDAVLRGLQNPVAGPLFALIAGILTSASPCALSAMPLVFGHMTGSSKKTQVADLVFFLAGMTLALTAAGVIAGAVGTALSLSAPWVRWVAGLALTVGGAAYMGLFGRAATCATPLATEPDSQAGVGRSVPRPLAGAAMGALFGISASPCSTPALLAILAIVTTTGSIVRGILLMLFYSLGQSALVAVAGLGTSVFRGVLESSWGLRALAILRVIGGGIVTASGLYILVRPYI